MSFYEILTPFYDEIFPTNPKQADFLSTYFTKGSSLLDVGAGTGNTAIALRELGYKVTAMEPEKSMAEMILRKDANMVVHFLAMEQIQQLPETYDGIYCIGNTLVHLENMGKIKTFLTQVFHKLNKEGKFIIQIVNYEQKDIRFPIINRGNVTFERSYQYEGEHILFTSTLTLNGKRLSSSIPLYPLTSSQLLPLLKEVGFQNIEVYGNFAKVPYTETSSALVVVAKK